MSQQMERDVHLLAAPARAVSSFIQTLCILALLIVIGTCYPLLLLVNHQPVTFLSLVVSGLTFLAVVNLFYAPVYFSLGGLLLICLFWLLGTNYPQFMVAHFYWGSTGLFWLVLSFLVVGILQRYIRHRLFDPPKYHDPRPADWMGRKDLPKGMGPIEYETLRILHGENESTWPGRKKPMETESFVYFKKYD